MSKYDSKSQEQTEQIAETIGKHLKGGECIELIGDVGAGKTTFVRGLAKGAGSRSHVSSPTFTISKVYDSPHFQIVHFDFYRLHDAELIKHELEEYLDDNNTVVVIEWSEVISDVLPDNRVKVTIANNSEDGRNITVRLSEHKNKEG